LPLDQADWAVSRRKNLEILDKRGAARFCRDGVAEGLRCLAERWFVEQARQHCTDFLGRGGARQGKAGAPTADRSLFLILRLYGPEKAAFERTWRLPEVEKAQ
jgi:hypothetical protein